MVGVHSYSVKACLLANGHIEPYNGHVIGARKKERWIVRSLQDMVATL